MAARTKTIGRVVLLHGAEFRGSQSRDNMRRLAPAFRNAGFCPIIPTYGYFPAILLGLIPLIDRRIAKSVSAFIQPNDILVGHSNGGTLVHLISKLVKIRGAILINAALESDIVPNADFIHVYYNEDDIITRISTLFPFSPWGAMGGLGYTGTDVRVINIDCGYPPTNLPTLSGHSAIFQRGNTLPWSKYMAQLCLQAFRLFME